VRATQHLRGGKEGARRGKSLLAPSLPPLCPLFALSQPRTNRNENHIEKSRDTIRHEIEYLFVKEDFHMEFYRFITGLKVVTWKIFPGG